MSSYRIGVWSSYALQDHCENQYGDPLRAARNCQTFLEAAAEKTSHTMDPIVKTKRIQTPTEDYRESFETWDPCEENVIGYSGLLPWFRDTMNCGGFPEPDSNVLLTNLSLTSGGIGYVTGQYSVVGTGQTTAESDGVYKSMVNQHSPEDGISTVLHEVGHNLGDHVTDSDGDGGGHHDCGKVYYDSGEESVTTMSSSAHIWI